MSNIMKSYYKIILLSFCQFLKADLTVNVESEGIQQIRMNISTNQQDQYTLFEYVTQDNSLINHFLDYKNNLQVLKATILGEEDLGQDFYQVLCFILPFNLTESLSLNDISILRQKMPNSVRKADVDHGISEIYMQYFVPFKNSKKISKLISKHCHEAQLSTFTISNNFMNKIPNTILEPFPNTVKQKSCPGLKDNDISSCMCKFEYCLLWYPCQLTYCKDKNYVAAAEYKCGIKSCKKCFRLFYLARNRYFCTYYY